MRKDEYLRKLENLLYNIPAEDREEALQFYRDYLEDAGEEADEVLAALGTPEELAESIRRDLYGDNADGSFTRTSKDLPGNYRVPFSTGGRFSGNHGNDRKYAGGNYSGAQDTYQGTGAGSGYYEYDAKQERKARKGKLSTGQWIIFIILFLCAAPIIVPVFGGLLAALIAIVIAIIAVVFGVGVAGIALVIAAIAIVVVAIVKLFVTPFSALIMVGGGLLMIGVGLVGIALTAWVVCKVLPAIFVWIVGIFSGIVHRK